MKLQLRRNLKCLWFWRIKADNGKILAHSEMYSSKTKARKTMMRVLDQFSRLNVTVEEEE